MAAVGFVQSIKGNWIATYRSFSYTYGQHIIKRLQSWFDIIAVLPGPVTCFSCDIIEELDFVSESLTEDFDLTLQIHRKKLGRIKFIPEAVNYTQDPRTIKQFVNQTLRWQRGFFQGVRKYKIGLKPHLIDLGIGYQTLDSLYYLIQILVILPLVLVVTNDVNNILFMLLADFLIVAVLAVFSAIVAKRFRILISLSYFYVLRFLELGIFIWAFVEIIILQKFKSVQNGWKTEGRRYAISSKNLEDL